MHEPLALLVADGVEHLLHAGHAERQHVEHLRLPPGEQGGAVGAFEHVHFGGQRPDLGGGAPVHPDAFGQDPLAHHLLDQGPQSPPRLGGGLFVLCELLRHPFPQGRLGGGPLPLVDETNQLGHSVRGQLLDRPVDLIGVVDERRPLPDFPALRRSQLELQVDQRTDVDLGRLQTLGHRLLVGRRPAVGDQPPGGFGGARLDHHDVDRPRLVAPPGHHQVEHALFQFLEGGERDPAAFPEAHTDASDRPLEGEVAQRQRRRGPVQGQNVVGVLPVRLDDQRHHVGVVPVSVAERRPQGAVDQPGAQRGPLGGPALPPEERTGDLADRVHALLDVDRQREEVDRLPRLVVGGGGDQGFGPAHGHLHRSVGQSGHLAG